MKILLLHIPGKAIGYCTHGSRQSWDRKVQYYNYKKRVQWTATERRIRLPLVATEERPVFIRTQLFCKKRIHADPENIHKGIVDALFYEKKKGAKGTKDKHCGGVFQPATYGDKDGVDVIIAYGVHSPEELQAELEKIGLKPGRGR